MLGLRVGEGGERHAVVRRTRRQRDAWRKQRKAEELSGRARMCVQSDAATLFHTDFTRTSASSPSISSRPTSHNPSTLMLRFKLECKKNASVIPKAFQTMVRLFTYFTV